MIQPDRNARPAAERILHADWVAPGAGLPLLRDGAVTVGADGRIVAVGPAAGLPEGAAVEHLGAVVLMPGLVNAHQHGRGVSQLLMGYPDLPLEPWMAGRRRHGPPDIFAVTRLAAEAMLANGVTATLHANYSYASGDYAAEVEAQIAAYRAAGLRVTICLGVQDRGALIYPDGDDPEAASAFAAGLPPAAKALVSTPARPAWMPDLAASLALMDRLQRDHGGDPRLSFAWGPAGPQWVEDATWTRLAVDAAARGVGLHFHLLESPAQAVAARRLYPAGTLAHLRGLGVFAARTSCAHGVHMTDEDRRIAAGEGLAVVLNPGSNLRLGNGPPPVAALRAAGVTLALGTDNCALGDDEDLLAEQRLAALLGRTGAAPDGWGAGGLGAGGLGAGGLDAGGPGAGGLGAGGLGAGGLGAEADRLLAMLTTGGARAAFLPEGTGRLEPGAPADLCAFRLEPATGDAAAWSGSGAGSGSGSGSGAETGAGADPARLIELLLARGRGADCVLTMVGGVVRHRARPEDRARLAEWRARAAASVAARAELAGPEAVAALQAALTRHYAVRAAPPEG